MATTPTGARTNASEHPLQALIFEMTSCDPTVEPAFEWSTDLDCDACGTRDSTAVVILDWDGETRERLCFSCLSERM